MSKKAVSPADIIADGVEKVEIKGVEIRKGTAGAFLANIEILEAADASEAEKQAAIKMIEQLAPAMIAVNLHKHATWKNKIVQAIFDKLVKTQN